MEDLLHHSLCNQRCCYPFFDVCGCPMLQTFDMVMRRFRFIILNPFRKCLLLHACLAGI